MEIPIALELLLMKRRPFTNGIGTGMAAFGRASVVGGILIVEGMAAALLNGPLESRHNACLLLGSWD